MKELLLLFLFDNNMLPKKLFLNNYYFRKSQKNKESMLVFCVMPTSFLLKQGVWRLVSFPGVTSP